MDERYDLSFLANVVASTGLLGLSSFGRSKVVVDE